MKIPDSGKHFCDKVLFQNKYLVNIKAIYLKYETIIPGNGSSSVPDGKNFSKGTVPGFLYIFFQRKRLYISEKLIYFYRNWTGRFVQRTASLLDLYLLLLWCAHDDEILYQG